MVKACYCLQGPFARSHIAYILALKYLYEDHSQGP